MVRSWTPVDGVRPSAAGGPLRRARWPARTALRLAPWLARAAPRLGPWPALAALLLVLAPVGAQDQGQGQEVAGIGAETPPAPKPGPNLLLVIADDMGVDLVGAYGEHPDPARTPVIDSLAATGVLFRNAWVTPGCSATRACLLTGRHPFETGVGRALTYANTTFELGPDEPSLARTLAEAGYRTAAVGKWHLAGANLSGPQHPLLMGFEHHRGPMDNLIASSGVSYFQFDKAVDGVITQSTTYATTDQVDDALDLIGQFGASPWFLWMAFNAPHGPYHAPPEHLHSYTLPAELEGNLPLFTRAMTESLDTELGRLLAGIPADIRARTVVIVIGDNGTPKVGTTLPFDSTHAKGTTYEGGVNVPLIVAGGDVALGKECSALVTSRDVVATIGELTGVDTSFASDARSFAAQLSSPLLPGAHEFVVTQAFAPSGFGAPLVNDNRAVRGDRFKLRVDFEDLGAGPVPASYELYDLAADPFEANDLSLPPLGPYLQGVFDELLAQLLATQPW
jgi:arylsulfatase A-like enzyme